MTLTLEEIHAAAQDFLDSLHREWEGRPAELCESIDLAEILRESCASEEIDLDGLAVALLESALLESLPPGYTGYAKDSAGRNYYYVKGVRQANHNQSAAPKPGKAKLQAMPVEELKRHLAELPGDQLRLMRAELGAKAPRSAIIGWLEKNQHVGEMSADEVKAQIAQMSLSFLRQMRDDLGAQASVKAVTQWMGEHPGWEKNDEPQAPPETKPQEQPQEQPSATEPEKPSEPTAGDGPGSEPVASQPGEDGGPVAAAPGGPDSSAGGGGGADADKPAGEATLGRVPARIEEVNKRLDRFGDFFRGKGQYQVADWMAMLRDHVNSVGVESALDALGPEVAGTGEEVQYGGSVIETGDFAEQYLSRNGISVIQGNAPGGGGKIVSTVAPSSDDEGLKSRGRTEDVFPALQTLRNKLHEAQHLPGLEKSEDIGKLMGKEFGAKVPSFTPEVLAKLDETYGAGKWIVKSYGDEAYAGYGIFFPQRVQQIRQDAQNTIWASWAELAKYGFAHSRDESGRVVGIKHASGDEYLFGTKKYADTINGDAREWADKAARAAASENATAIPEGSFMAQPAFAVVGISNEERAAGVTFKKGQEGRVHIVTRNGKAEIVPHSTWLKEEHLPVVFESEDTRAMAKAALDAINALPESERRSQLYAPDIVKTADGYRVVEANPANEAGASGYLQDNPFIIDAYVSQVAGREPAHVKFIRKLLTGKK